MASSFKPIFGSEPFGTRLRCRVRVSIHVKTEETMKLIFAGDPMSSWCYEFGKEMSAIDESMPDLDVQIVVGGMAAGSTQRPDDAGKQFCLTHGYTMARGFDHGRKGDELIP